MTAKPGTIKLEVKSRAPKETRLTGNDVRGVVYGKKQQAVPVVAERLALRRIHDNLGFSVIFDLVIEGEAKPLPVLLHDVQYQPNSNEIIHFDLYAVTMDQKIKTDVPIHFDGEAAAQADSDKTLNTILDKLEVEALPADLPENLVLDISDLAEIGDTKHVSDIELPSGVVVLNDAEAAIVKVEEVQEIEEPEAEESEISGEDDSEQAQADGSSEDAGSNENSEDKTE